MVAPVLARAACGALLALAALLLQGCEIGERPMMHDKRRHFNLLVPSNIHISQKPVNNEPTKEPSIRPLQHLTTPAPKPVVQAPAVPQPTHAPQPLPAPPAPVEPNCPAVNLEMPNGKVRISQSMAGEFPKVQCSSDFEYHGPRVQCNWVDRACKVGLEGDASVSNSLCHMEYNLTLPGAGLKSWPEGVAPRLVPPWEKAGLEDASLPDDEAKSRILQTINLKNFKRNTDALPVVVNRNLLLCKRQKLPDLDFEHAPIDRSYPPFTKEKPWFKTYSGIMAVNDEKVDLRVTRVGSVEAPGNAWLDGNSSAVGRISVNSTEQTHLRFQFVRSGTLAPVVLPRVYFTLFDVDGGHGSIHSKKVTAGGMVAYYISESSSLVINKTNDGRFEFLGDSSDGGRQPSDSSVEDMWLNSLKRTVVLDFRDTAEFTIAVQALPHPNGQVLEFAGWSELVEEGMEISTAEDRAAILQRFSASSDDEPHDDQVTDASVDRSNAVTPPSSFTLPPLHRLPAAVFAIAGTLLLAAMLALGASVWRGHKLRLSRREAVCTKTSQTSHMAIFPVADGVHEAQ